MNKYCFYACPRRTYGMVSDENETKVKYTDLEFWRELEIIDFPIIEERYGYIKLMEFYE